MPIFNPCGLMTSTQFLLYKENNMINTELFNTNTLIDTVQNAKRDWINTVVTEDTVSKPLVAALEAETSFAKSLTEATEKYVNTLGDAFVDKA